MKSCLIHEQDGQKLKRVRITVGRIVKEDKQGQQALGEAEAVWDDIQENEYVLVCCDIDIKTFGAVVWPKGRHDK